MPSENSQSRLTEQQITPALHLLRFILAVCLSLYLSLLQMGLFQVSNIYAIYAHQPSPNRRFVLLISQFKSRPRKSSLCPNSESENAKQKYYEEQTYRQPCHRNSNILHSAIKEHSKLVARIVCPFMCSCLIIWSVWCLDRECLSTIWKLNKEGFWGVVSHVDCSSLTHPQGRQRMVKMDTRCSHREGRC